MTGEKRLVMPPGTQMVLTPTLALPFLRYISVTTLYCNLFCLFVHSIKNVTNPRIKMVLKPTLALPFLR